MLPKNMNCRRIYSMDQVQNTAYRCAFCLPTACSIVLLFIFFSPTANTEKHISCSERMVHILGFRGRLKSTFALFMCFYFSQSPNCQSISQNHAPMHRSNQPTDPTLRFDTFVCVCFFLPPTTTLYLCARNKLVIHLLVINFMELFSRFWPNVNFLEFQSRFAIFQT